LTTLIDDPGMVNAPQRAERDADSRGVNDEASLKSLIPAKADEISQMYAVWYR
jgi:hypothetical protein